MQAPQFKVVKKHHIAQAHFIVGCLISEQLVDFQDENDGRLLHENVNSCVKIIAACLANYETPEGDHAILPFRW